MRYILLFLLISISGALFTLNLAIEDNSKKRYLKKDFFQSNTAEVPIIIKNSNKTQDTSLPKVKLLLPQNKDYYTWDTQVRYFITVSDVKDGDSRYGEINGNEVLLEIEYLPITNEEELKRKIEMSKKGSEHNGLALMKKSTCFDCHADKTVLSGPSFFEIAKRYEKTSQNIESLASRVLGGSVGVWGSITMPSHPDFTVEETEQIVEYILRQGRTKNNWILPGLEGTFRIQKKPDNCANGLYLLTASYTSKSQMKGQHSVALRIR
jgi:cytochrome c